MAGGSQIKRNVFLCILVLWMRQGNFSSKGVFCFLIITFGKWRSPVAHLYGVQGVAGSNPVFPTVMFVKKHQKPANQRFAGFFMPNWAANNESV